MATARAKDTRSFEDKRLRLLVHIAASPAAAANQNQSGLVNVAVGDVSVLNDANVGVAAQVAANILRRQGRTDRGVGEPGRPKWGLTDRVQHGSGSGHDLAGLTCRPRGKGPRGKDFALIR
jgi:hypothetical protein